MHLSIRACKTLRNIFLVLFGICISIGIALIDNPHYIYTIIIFIIAFICICISLIFDNLIIEIAYKNNNNERN